MGEVHVSESARLRLRLAVLISRLKNTVDWFVVREKYCSDWKNKLKSMDYKPDEQGYILLENIFLWKSSTSSSNTILLHRAF
jgi:hypothetical protein